MSNYARGANFERRVKKMLEKDCWFVIRSAGSHSPVDLVAIKRDEIKLIQCKIRKPSPKERESLYYIHDIFKCDASLFYRNGKKIVEIQL